MNGEISSWGKKQRKKTSEEKSRWGKKQILRYFEELQLRKLNSCSEMAISFKGIPRLL